MRDELGTAHSYDQDEITEEALAARTFLEHRQYIALGWPWIVGYSCTSSDSHLGAFFGNSIADWSGSVVIILGTKFLYEAGSAESRPLKNRKSNRWLELLHEHSLLIFLAVTGIGWLIVYLKMNPQDKWGQVVGNIISEWLQMAGLVFLTKRLIERGSKESH